MVNPKIVLISILGASTIGGGFAAIYYFTKSSPKNIKELLISKNLTPLNTENDVDNTIWIKLIKKHAATTGNHLSQKISGLNFSNTALNNPSSDDINKIKGKCRILFNSPITNDSEFNTKKDHATAWCTKQSNFARG